MLRPTDTSTGPLDAGSRICQQFKADGDLLEGISLAFKPTATNNAFGIVLSIYSSSGASATLVQDYKHLATGSGSWLRLDFKPTGLAPNQLYWFCIEITNCSQPVEILTNNSTDGTCLINGNLIDDVICFDVHYQIVRSHPDPSTSVQYQGELSPIFHEFLIPASGDSLSEYIEKGDLSAVHHLIRYQWAKDVLADSGVTYGHVLDAGCGAGYGTYMLASSFPALSLVGVDHDPEAVRIARKNYSLPNLTYIVGDLISWENVPTHQEFDLFISFDSIEHIKHRELMLENFVNHMRADAELFLSTPCTQGANILTPEWEFHAIEFSMASLFDFLSRYFRVVLRPDGEGFPSRSTFDVLEGTQISYLLMMNPVVCKQPIQINNNPYR